MFPSLNRYYEFRNIDFRLKDLFKLFLREYTKELFKHYEHYINQDEIKEHLQKVIYILKEKIPIYSK